VLEPVEVLGERERSAAVDPNHLERPVAAEKALVRGRDRSLVRRQQATVDRGELFDGGSGLASGLHARTIASDWRRGRFSRPIQRVRSLRKEGPMYIGAGAVALILIIILIIVLT
jgi:hypothetical protein